MRHRELVDLVFNTFDVFSAIVLPGNGRRLGLWRWYASSFSRNFPPSIVAEFLPDLVSGATVQIFLFSMNSAKIKENAPRAHSFCEVIRVRWGTLAHIIFLCFSLVTSMLVSAMLVTGGSATVTDLTGASTQAICVLMPLGVAAYVTIGGLRKYSSPSPPSYSQEAFVFSKSQ